MKIRRTPAGVFTLLVFAWAGSAAAGEGLVALQSAQPSCAPIGGSDFYYACGNGTVTDRRSGLVWLANANCIGQVDLPDAMEIVAGLGDLEAGECGGGVTEDDCDCGLGDGSAPGEWRLPSLDEWETMVADADAMGCTLTITDDEGDGCWNEACVDDGDCSFYDPVAFYYWSSSPSVLDEDFGWSVDLSNGEPTLNFKTLTVYVWPVRGGQ